MIGQSGLVPNDTDFVESRSSKEGVAGNQETDQRGRQSRKGKSDVIGGCDNGGNQRGEASEGREPHECDQAERRLGIIGRSQGVERLGKPEDALKSELGKVGRFFRNPSRDLVRSDGQEAWDGDASRVPLNGHVDFR